MGTKAQSNYPRLDSSYMCTLCRPASVEDLTKSFTNASNGFRLALTSKGNEFAVRHYWSLLVRQGKSNLEFSLS